MAPLQWQNLDVALTGGVAQDVADPLVPNGRLLKCENVVFDKRGAMHKRRGFIAHSTPHVSMGDIEQVWEQDGVICATDGSYVWRHDPNLGIWVTSSDMRLPDFRMIAKHELYSNPEVDAAELDAVYCNGYIVWARTLLLVASGNGCVEGGILEYPGNRWVYKWDKLQSTRDLAYGPPRLVVEANRYVWAIYATYTGGAVTLRARVLDTEDPNLAWGTEQTIVTNCQATRIDLAYDALNDGTYTYVAVNLAAGTLYLWKCDRTFAGAVTATYTPASAVLRTVCLSRTGSVLWASYFRTAPGSGAYVQPMATLNLIATSAELYTGASIGADVRRLTTAATADGILIIVEWVSVTYRLLHYLKIDAAYTVSGTHRLMYAELTIASKAYFANGSVFLVLRQSGNLYSTGGYGYLESAYCLVAIDEVDTGFVISERARVVAGLAYGIAGNSGNTGARSAGSYAGAQFTSPDSGKTIMVALPTKYGGVTNLASTGSLFVFDNTLPPSLPVKWGNSVQFANNTVFDGRTACESSFVHPPMIDYVADGGVTGGLSAGDYSWTAVWEWFDRNGIRYQSAPGKPYLLNFAASLHKATIRVNSLALSTRVSTAALVQDAHIVFYRNTLNYPTIYRRCVPYAVTLGTGIARINPETMPWDLTESAADSSVEEQEILYTDGGVPPSVCPPGFLYMVSWQGRLWGISAENPRQLWFSQPWLGDQGPAWSPVLTIDLLGEDTAVALAPMVDRLVVLKNNSVSVVVGDGPALTGLNGTYLEQELVRGIGCSQAKSVVTMPAGVFFMSAGGIRQLTQGGDFLPVGDPVQDEFLTYPQVNAATHLPDRDVVVFCVSDTSESVGQVLAYNYAVNAWSVWKISDSVGSLAVLKASGVVGGLWHWASKDGNVYKDDTYYWDAQPVDRGSKGDWITLKIETPWLKIGALAGFQRARKVTIVGHLQHAQSSHGLVVATARDYVDTATSELTIAYGSMQSYSVSERILVPMRFLTQRCAAVKIQIYDTAGDDTNFATYQNLGIGPRIDGLTLELGLKRGQHRVGDT